MRIPILAASLLSFALAGSAFGQSNSASVGSMMNTNNPMASAPSKPGAVKKHTTAMNKNAVKNNTSRAINKQNCKSKKGKNSLQTQGGNSGTENTEDTCADNNN